MIFTEDSENRLERRYEIQRNFFMSNQHKNIRKFYLILFRYFLETLRR